MLVLGVLSIVAACMVAQLGGPEAALDAVKKSLNGRGGFGMMRADEALAPKRKWGLKLPPKPPAPPKQPAPLKQPPQLAQPKASAPPPSEGKAAAARAARKAAGAAQSGKAADKPKEEPPHQTLSVIPTGPGEKRRKLFKVATTYLTSIGNKLVRRK